MTAEQENEIYPKAGNGSIRVLAWRYPLVTLILVIAAFAAGYFVDGGPPPGPDSAEVGFARDMSDHHHQAVEMATLIYNRTDDELIRILAYDILTTQQAEIGIMSGWLDGWGHRWSDSGPRMVWMGMSVEGQMPGMASADEINELRQETGVDAEVLFLQLMITHHQSGAVMAEAAVERAKVSIVRERAQAMANAQELEIAYMRDLLRERGIEPTEDPAPMDMDMDG